MNEKKLDEMTKKRREELESYGSMDGEDIINDLVLYRWAVVNAPELLTSDISKIYTPDYWRAMGVIRSSKLAAELDLPYREFLDRHVVGGRVWYTFDYTLYINALGDAFLTWIDQDKKWVTESMRNWRKGCPDGGFSLYDEASEMVAVYNWAEIHQPEIVRLISREDDPRWEITIDLLRELKVIDGSGLSAEEYVKLRDAKEKEMCW